LPKVKSIAALNKTTLPYPFHIMRRKFDPLMEGGQKAVCSFLH
jgi:hypothetical protein